MEFVKKISSFIFGDSDFFRFQYPFVFLFLVLILALILFKFFLDRKNKNKINQFVRKGNTSYLFPNQSKNRAKFKFILWLTGFVFLILGLANVQFGTKKEDIKQEEEEINNEEL